MLILAVDTSTRTGSAAILRNSEVLCEVSGYEETPYSSRLFRDIALLQDRANLRLSEMNLFAVAAGPGSFTGLRVGLTAVKAWSEMYGKPIAAVSGLEAIASEAALVESSKGSAGRFIAPFLDARRGQLFGAIYRRVPGGVVRLELASDESILSLDEFLDLVKTRSSEGVQLVSATPEVLPPDRLAEVLPGVSMIQVSPALAPAIGRLGYERSLAGEVVDSMHLDANYVRRSDAELKWTDG
jgi:tRNA threonylcarbamoyladenosine biosynthesis protein TsaB